METSAVAAALVDPAKPFDTEAEGFGQEPWGRLGQLTQGLVDIVERVLTTAESMRSDVHGILKSLRKSLQRASDLVELACRSKIYRALRSDRIRTEYNDVTLRLRICLNGLDSLLSTKRGEATDAIRGDVKQLQESFGGTLFPKYGAEIQFCIETHNITSKIYTKETNARRGSIALRKLMLEAFDESQIKNEWPATSRQLFQDMDDARQRNDQHEEHYIRHILIALDILQNTHTLKNKRSGAANQKGIPPEFYCPISLRIMKQPVVLFETAVTYDRSSIEQWFKGYGDGTCPVSRTKLSSQSFVENKALKALIDDWLRNHDSKGDSDSSFDSCVSSLGDDSAFLDEACGKQNKLQDEYCFMPIDMEWKQHADAAAGCEEEFFFEDEVEQDMFEPQSILWDSDCEACEMETNDVNDGTWGVIDHLFLD